MTACWKRVFLGTGVIFSCAGQACYLSGAKLFAKMKGMKPLVKLEEMRAADGSLWELWERDGVLSLLQDGVAVADTLSRGSEERMAQLAVAPIARAGNYRCTSARQGAVHHRRTHP